MPLQCRHTNVIIRHDLLLRKVLLLKSEEILSYRELRKVLFHEKET